jgi:hypothetical protein
MSPASARLSLVDSEIGSHQLQGLRLRLDFSAAALQTERASPPHGYLKGVWLDLQLRHAVAPAVLQALRGRIHAASVALDGRALTALPLPWAAQGALHLTLQAGWGDALQLQASAATLHLPSDAPHTEGLAC